MDPALWELYESGSGEDEVRVMLRLREGAVPPNNVRIVSRFGPIATARLRRADIPEVWDSDALISVKAPRPVWLPAGPGAELRETDEADEMRETDEAESFSFEPRMPARESEPRPVPEDGSGVLVGVCDWGLDFTHANF